MSGCNPSKPTADPEPKAARSPLLYSLWQFVHGDDSVRLPVCDMTVKPTEKSERGGRREVDVCGREAKRSMRKGRSTNKNKNIHNTIDTA